MKKSIVFIIVAAVLMITAMSAFAANEPDMNKYEVTYHTGENGELIIRNTYKPQMKSIPVIKEWEDDSNRDNYRPASICVELRANDVVVDNHTLNGEGNTWTYTFENKVVFNRGETITYTVSENGMTCEALETPSTENVCLLAGGSWADNTCTMPTASQSNTNNDQNDQPGQP